jgi:hypothetical protein
MREQLESHKFDGDIIAFLTQLLKLGLPKRSPVVPRDLYFHPSTVSTLPMIDPALTSTPPNATHSNTMFQGQSFPAVSMVASEGQFYSDPGALQNVSNNHDTDFGKRQSVMMVDAPPLIAYLDGESQHGNHLSMSTRSFFQWLISCPTAVTRQT